MSTEIQRRKKIYTQQTVSIQELLVLVKGNYTPSLLSREIKAELLSVSDGWQKCVNESDVIH
jgi:hypothetical protein